MNQKESILTVDDDVSIGRSLALIFTKKGYEAETAVTAQEAIEKAMERSFHIALIDIRLPDMPGTDLLKKLKDINPKINCMIITGYASVENAVKSLELGASAYITKPLDMDDVLNRIKEALNKQKLEQELIKSEEKYRNLYENAPDMYISVSPETGRIIRCNKVVVRNTGYTKEEIIGRPYLEMYHPDCLEKAKKTLQQFVTTGEVRDVELRLRRKDGGRLEVSLNVSALRDTAGKITNSYSSWRDITERKQAEEGLQESEEKYRAIIEQSIDGIMISDQHAKIAIWNKSMESITGIQQGDAIGKPLWEIQLQLIPKEQVTPELLKQLQIASKNILELKIDWPGESREQTIICADGTPKVVQDSSFIIKTADTIRFGTIMRDITEHKQAEEKLSETKEYLENLIKYANAPIMVWDTSLSITRFNRAFENLSGFDASEVIGKKIEILFSKDKIVSALKHIQKTSSGERWENIEIEIQKKDGEPRIVLWNAANILNSENKNIIATIAQGQDITKRKQVEKSLRKSEKELKLSNQKLQKTMKSTIQAIALILEKRDPYTTGHQERVTKLACTIAKEINFSPDKIERLYIAGILHDIGKINVPIEILSKPGRLSDIEFNLIKNHSQAGSDLLRSMDLPGEVSTIVLQHHERMDGSGYPSGLSGEAILVEARILGVADVVEAMASHRPYRPALGLGKALEEITQNRGKLYDPQVVDACLKLFKEKGFKFE